MMAYVQQFALESIIKRNVHTLINTVNDTGIENIYDSDYILTEYVP